MSSPSKLISAKEVALQWFDRYRSQDVEGMVALFATEAIIEYVPLHLKATASELAANGWSVLIDAFPDLTNQIEEVSLDETGKVAFVDVYIGGTQRKDAFGIPKSNYLLFNCGMTENGKIDRVGDKTKFVSFVVQSFCSF
jgi:ketosteroid isomerase-like protein